MTICAKCCEGSEMTAVARFGRSEWRVCSSCGCTAIYRVQEPRGLVARRGLVQSVVEIAGELESP